MNSLTGSVIKVLRSPEYPGDRNCHNRPPLIWVSAFPSWQFTIGGDRGILSHITP
ncbi:MAG: hypothetical protein GDA48_16900 [Hormoscilla sp. GM102CHS1]|nr:hypothetical protein [Hormoscilla sp. GM102CHS1]